MSVREVFPWPPAILGEYLGKRGLWTLTSRLENAVAYLRSHVGATGVTIIAGFMLTIVSPIIAAAATKEEVAHCRAIEQRAERLDCFKSLKQAPKTKTEEAAPAKTEEAAPPVTEDAASAKMEHAAPSKTEDAEPAKTKRAARVKTKRAARVKTEDAASEKTGEAVPAKAEDAAPAPAKTENTTKSKTGDSLLSSTSDDPATTSSIDRFNFVPGQPLCEDRNAVAAMLVAGLLTSNPKEAATNGCQTVPEDAKLELLERYPSVFPSIRIVRVRVTSPTWPALTFGFTVETGR